MRVEEEGKEVKEGKRLTGVEEEGKELKEGKRLPLGVVTPDTVLVYGRSSIINVRNCVVYIELSTPYVALFNANAEVGRDARV